MKSISNRFGGNLWLILVLLFSILSRNALKVISVIGAARYIIIFFMDYSAFAFILSHCVIFQSEGIRIAKNLPRKPKWKRWFFLLYTPHLVYSLWLGAFLTVHDAPVGLLFTVGMCFLLRCAYLRLSAADEVSPPPVDKDGTAEP